MTVCDTLHHKSLGLVTKHLWAPVQVNLENAPEAGLIGEALLFPRCACAPVQGLKRSKKG